MDRGYMHQTKIGQLKDFFCAVRALDKTFKILPFLSLDQKLQNIHTSQFDPNKMDIT